MICDKDGIEHPEIPEKYKEYKGIDRHHNPPEYMVDKWEGKMLYLCRKHHKELHKFILEIIKKYSNKKNTDSEYWCWLYCFDKKKCGEEVIKFTNDWLIK